MKNFVYLEPRSVEEASELLKKHGWEAKAMAGGQSLILLLREGLIQPGVVVSLLEIPGLNQIQMDRSGRTVEIGALATHRQMELSPVIRQNLSFVTKAYQTLGSVQVRNLGTLGGNLCHNAPGSDPPPLLMVLDATLSLTGPSTMKGAGKKRTLTVEEFGTGFYETALQEGEILTSVQIPLPPPRSGCAYQKYSLRPTDVPFAGVAVRITLAKDGNKCDDVRIALTGVAPTTIRARRAEAVLRGREIGERLMAEAGQVAGGEIDPISDAYASAEYRRQIVPVAVRRVAAEAWQRARTGWGG
jgi:carbon-monoxide dehydrogenase medium subunit